MRLIAAVALGEELMRPECRDQVIAAIRNMPQLSLGRRRNIYGHWLIALGFDIRGRVLDDVCRHINKERHAAAEPRSTPRA